MIMSMMHRISGFILYLGSFLFLVWYLSIFFGQDAYNYVNQLFSLSIVKAENQANKKYIEAASRNEGNAENGKKIFYDKRSLCSECHSINGKANSIGPDLAAAGDKFSKSDIIQSIIHFNKFKKSSIKSLNPIPGSAPFALVDSARARYNMSRQKME